MQSVTCKNCEGRGQVYAATHYVTCGTCGGQGRVLQPRKMTRNKVKGVPKTRGANHNSGNSSGFFGLLGAGVIFLVIMWINRNWEVIVKTALTTLIWLCIIALILGTSFILIKLYKKKSLQRKMADQKAEQDKIWDSLFDGLTDEEIDRSVKKTRSFFDDELERLQNRRPK